MDDEVRALERATSAGDLASALRLAHSLERAGRPDQVIPALLGGRGHPAIRRELGARWDRLQLADARFVDAPPVLRPRVRWLTKLDGRDQVHTLLAHPLGVVAATKSRTVVLDPETGAPLDLPAARRPRIAGDVLLLYRSSQLLEAYDLVSGELLHATKLVGATDSVATAGGLLVTGQAGSARAYRLVDPRAAPALAWTQPCDSPWDVRVTRTRVLLTHPIQGFHALDHEGQERWRRPPLDGHLGVVDDDLVLLDRAAGPALGAEDGAIRWPRPAGSHALALTPRAALFSLAEHVLSRVEDSPQAHASHGALYDWSAIDVHDRATGERLASLVEDRYLGGTAVARDVLYAVVGASRKDPVVVARRLDGTRLWQLTTRELQKSAPHSLAASWGRLYAAGNRFVACVEESP